MKTVVVYYSYTGNTRKLAAKIAKKQGAVLVEVKEKKARSKVGTYVFGSFAAMRQKKSKIEPIKYDLNKFDKIIIAVPVWAGYPAPALNSIIELLPSDKNIELVLSSGSGDSSKSADKTKALISRSGAKSVIYTDVKSVSAK